MGNVLLELLPRKVRLVLYVIVGIAGMAIAAWEASEGDWLTFIASIVASFTGLLAAGNVNPPTPPPVPDISKVSDASLLAEIAARGPLVVPTKAVEELREKVIEDPNQPPLWER